MINKLHTRIIAMNIANYLSLILTGMNPILRHNLKSIVPIFPGVS